MTDYAIARRIIDLHSRMEESVERFYSVVRSVSRFLVISLKNFDWSLHLYSVQF